MKRIKAFFYILYKSVTSPGYYNEILDTNFGFSTKYFLSLSLLASLVISITVTIRLTPKLNEGFNEILGEIKQIYPDDLILSSKENVWSVNKSEPYIVPFPKIAESALNESEGTINNDETQIPANLIVLNHAGTVEDMEKHDTLILVNEKNMLVKDASGLQTYPLENIPDGELDKQKFEEFINRLWVLAPYIPYVVGVLTLLFAAFYFLVFRFIALLLVGAILWVASNAMKLGLTYKQAFRVAVHAMTLPLLVELVSISAQYPIPLPLWFFLVNVIFGIVALNSLDKSRASQVV